MSGRFEIQRHETIHHRYGRYPTGTRAHYPTSSCDRSAPEFRERACVPAEVVETVVVGQITKAERSESTLTVRILHPRRLDGETGGSELSDGIPKSTTELLTSAIFHPLSAMNDFRGIRGPRRDGEGIYPSEPPSEAAVSPVRRRGWPGVYWEYCKRIPAEQGAGSGRPSRPEMAQLSQKIRTHRS